MNPERYAEWVAKALEAGATRQEIQWQISIWQHEHRKISAGLCPRCDAPISRRVDPRQAGPVEMSGGVWVNYRCSRDAPIGERGPRPCGFAVDLYEEDT